MEVSFTLMMQKTPLWSNVVSALNGARTNINSMGDIKCRTNKMPMYVESFYVCAIQNCGSLAFTLHTKWNKRRTTRSVLIVKHEKRKRERKMRKKKEKAKIHRNPTTSTHTNTYTVETKQRKIVWLDPLAYTWLWAHIRLLHRIALYVSVVLAHGIHFMC